MANHSEGWKQVGEAITYIVGGIAATVGANKIFKRPSKAASSEDEERESSALARVDIHLDRISRVLDEQNININDQNIQLLRVLADIRSIKRELMSLANKVSDLESKDTT